MHYKSDHCAHLAIELLERRDLLATNLIADINVSPAPSVAGAYAQFGDELVVRVNHYGRNGHQLWKTDGTEQGTMFLLEADSIAPGASINGVSYFRSGSELWKTDGTPEGTELVKNIGQSLSTSLRLGDLLVFIGNDGNTGDELWRSDGTAEGTFLVKDIQAGPNGSSIFRPTVVGNTVYFRADDGHSGAELWKSDGTPEGTVLVHDINPGAASSNLSGVAVQGDTIYFSATVSGFGEELWKSDGTSEGTSLVLNIHPTTSSFPRGITVVNDYVYFVASDGKTGRELWRSDGTAIGTSLVADIVPGIDSFAYFELTALGDLLFFTMEGELWKSDGTADGTVNVMADVLNPKHLTVVGEALYFVGDLDPIHSSPGDRLYRSDGTAAGTVVIEGPTEFHRRPRLLAVNESLYLRDGLSFLWFVEDANTQQAQMISFSDRRTIGSFPISLTQLGTNWVFFAEDESDTEETRFGLWSTDGRPGSATRLAGFNTRVGAAVGDRFVVIADSQVLSTDGTLVGTRSIFAAQPSEIVRPAARVSGRWYFSVSDAHAREGDAVRLWRTNGTVDGTFQLHDDVLPQRNYFGTHLNSVGGEAFFWTPGGELWTTDGTREGTRMLTAVGQPGAVLEGLGDGAFFRYESSPDAGTSVLGVTDGTADGTRELQRFTALGPFRSVNGLMYFQASTEDADSSLWRSDGTVEGTFPLIEATVAVSTISTVNDNTLFWSLSDPCVDRFCQTRTLWRTDGTSAGTVPIQTIVLEPPIPGAPVFPNVGSVFEQNGLGYFIVRSLPGELWVTDGTEQGTRMLAHIRPFGSVQQVNGVTYFPGYHAETGYELWRTDGTLAGTQLVKDIWPGAADGVGVDLQLVSTDDGVTLLVASDPEAGQELWTTDGSADGTFRLYDFEPGPDGSETSIVWPPRTIPFSFFPFPPFPPRPTEDEDGPVIVSALTTTDESRQRLFLIGAEGAAAEPIFSGLSAQVLAVDGQRIFIAGDDGIHGTELWVYTPGPLVGDTDGDGDVDFADFLTLSTNFGVTDASFADGDFNGDGRVTFADFLMLSAGFGGPR